MCMYTCRRMYMCIHVILHTNYSVDGLYLHDISKECGLGDGEEVQELDHLGVPAVPRVIRHT